MNTQKRNERRPLTSGQRELLADTCRELDDLWDAKCAAEQAEAAKITWNDALVLMADSGDVGPLRAHIAKLDPRFARFVHPEPLDNGQRRVDRRICRPDESYREMARWAEDKIRNNLWAKRFGVRKYNRRGDNEPKLSIVIAKWMNSWGVQDGRVTDNDVDRMLHVSGMTKKQKERKERLAAGLPPKPSRRAT